MQATWWMMVLAGLGIGIGASFTGLGGGFLIVPLLLWAGFSGVQLRERVDPSLMGGLVVRIGSRLYDNSIKSKLQRLQYAMKGAA